MVWYSQLVKQEMVKQEAVKQEMARVNVNILGISKLKWTGWISLQSKGLSRVFSNTTVNAGLNEAQAGIKIAGRNINNLRYADDATLMAESKEPLDEGERGE